MPKAAALHFAQKGEEVAARFVVPILILAYLAPFASMTVPQLAAEPIPIYLYHFPAQSGLPWHVPLVKRLLDTFGSRIVGLKDSSGDMPYAREAAKIHQAHAASAQLLARSFRSTLRLAVAIGGLSSIVGLALGRMFHIAPGGAIVLVAAAFFAVGALWYGALFGKAWQKALWPEGTPQMTMNPAVAFAGSSLPVTVSFGAGGKSNIFCIWAMCVTWIRSRMFMPFFIA